jgi:hypothetical protein
MVDYQSVKTYFESKNLSYYTFYPKSENPIKAVIRHLPVNTLAEDIAEGLVDLGFDVISVKQMSTACRSSEGTTHITPAFVPCNPTEDNKSPKTCLNCPTSATSPSR